MNANELRERYLKFFESKGHTIVPSANLTPENDPTTLFTGSGMQPMINYLLGEKHPLGTRITDSQKCFRAQDIEEVGDNRHTTFFEMLGNWSFGDYFKKQQIEWMFEFLIKEVGLNPKKLCITVFRGNEKLGISRDNEAVEFWKEKFSQIGMEAKDVDFSERDGMQGGRIFYYEEKKNWWSRAGVPDNMPVGEPGGPDSEMFWDFGEELGLHEKSEFKDLPCHVNCDCGRFLEIGNNVFMQYKKTENGFQQLPKGNIDFGGGLERMVAVSENKSDIFLTDLFTLIIEKIEELSGKKYGESDDTTKSFRIIADHLKAGTFLIGDGVVPSNTGAGYVLRRLIRRAVRYGKLIGIEKDFSVSIAEAVIQMYGEAYPELRKQRETIFAELKKEEEKFRRTIEKGIKHYALKAEAGKFEIEDGEVDITIEKANEKREISGKDAFDLYQTYGFPIELTKEMAAEDNLRVDENEFNELLKKHQELSRTASAGMFKGGLQDASEETTKLHTTAHLMLAALRKVLGEHVAQKGSNITAERLRFDFSHGEKMTDDQKKEVEKLVNEAIEADATVKKEEMSLDEAKNAGAMGAFESKYGEKVTVYTVEKDGVVYSKEICGGPHVEQTGALGRFRIQKEEASSAGVRRIKAILE